ncbi:MAG: hypothetical protein KTR29_20830 [Rhodothermaceae bacterium]|nr:hypothetical protein [Rhodothermaceae bacterium]
MALIYNENGKGVWCSTLDETPEWVLPFTAQPYPCLIYACRDADPQCMAEVGQLLITSGCVFVVCAGKACERWHDAIDAEIIAAQATGSLDAEKTIMTTWHTRDSLEELVFFFVHTTFDANEKDHPGFKEALNSNYVVLVIGDERPELLEHIVESLRS